MKRIFKDIESQIKFVKKKCGQWFKLETIINQLKYATANASYKLLI